MSQLSREEHLDRLIAGVESQIYGNAYNLFFDEVLKFTKFCTDTSKNSTILKAITKAVNKTKKLPGNNLADKDQRVKAKGKELPLDVHQHLRLDRMFLDPDLPASIAQACAREVAKLEKVFLESHGDYSETESAKIEKLKQEIEEFRRNLHQSVQTPQGLVKILEEGKGNKFLRGVIGRPGHDSLQKFVEDHIRSIEGDIKIPKEIGVLDLVAWSTETPCVQHVRSKCGFEELSAITGKMKEPLSQIVALEQSLLLNEMTEEEREKYRADIARHKAKYEELSSEYKSFVLENFTPENINQALLEYPQLKNTKTKDKALGNWRKAASKFSAVAAFSQTPETELDTNGWKVRFKDELTNRGVVGFDDIRNPTSRHGNKFLREHEKEIETFRKQGGTTKELADMFSRKLAKKELGEKHWQKLEKALENKILGPIFSDIGSRLSKKGIKFRSKDLEKLRASMGSKVVELIHDNPDTKSPIVVQMLVDELSDMKSRKMKLAGSLPLIRDRMTKEKLSAYMALEGLDHIEPRAERLKVHLKHGSKTPEQVLTEVNSLNQPAAPKKAASSPKKPIPMPPWEKKIYKDAFRRLSKEGIEVLPEDQAKIMQEGAAALLEALGEYDVRPDESKVADLTDFIVEFVKLDREYKERTKAAMVAPKDPRHDSAIESDIGSPVPQDQALHKEGTGPVFDFAEDKSKPLATESGVSLTDEGLADASDTEEVDKSAKYSKRFAMLVRQFSGLDGDASTDSKSAAKEEVGRGKIKALQQKLGLELGGDSSDDTPTTETPKPPAKSEAFLKRLEAIKAASKGSSRKGRTSSRRIINPSAGRGMDV